MARPPLALVAALPLLLLLPACASHHPRPQPFTMRGVAVNAPLWRAALDTLNFAGIEQSDGSRGVIVTRWYSSPESPGERFKVTAYVLGKQLRPDAWQVMAAHQVYQGGTWIDSAVSAATVQKLEDVILTRARNLSRSAVGS